MDILGLLNINTLVLSENRIKEVLPLDYHLKAGDIASIVDFQTCLEKETINLNDLPEHLKLRVIKNFKRYILAKSMTTLHPVDGDKDYITLSIVKVGSNFMLQTTMSAS